jgi:tetratricopeptide (TPR) repeat protein
MNDLAILLVIYLTLFLSGPVTSIIHEMGHALAFMAFTKPSRIDIFIGSYGDAKKQYRFKAGKLRFYIKRSFPFVKGIGLCRSFKPERNYVKDIIISLAGPVVTFITAIIFSLLAFTIHSGLLVTIVCCIFLGYSLLSLFTNLIPNEITVRGGTMVDNDGRHVLFTMQLKEARPDYVDALELLGKNEQEAAVIKLKKVLIAAPNNKKILRLLINTLLLSKNYEEALSYSTELGKVAKFTNHDLLTSGILLSFTNKKSEAINAYNEVLRTDKKNVIALNNIGFELIAKGEYHVAEHALLKAITVRPSFDGAYNNLGELYLTQSKLPDAKAHIDKCLELNGDNADAYKNLGRYYLMMKNPQLAGLNFEKAVELNNNIDISDFQKELRSLLGEEMV